MVHRALVRYFDSLNQEISKGELNEIFSAKIGCTIYSMENRFSLESLNITAKKVRDSLYLTRDDDNGEIYNFYECSYDNIIVNITIIRDIIFWGLYYDGPENIFFEMVIGSQFDFRIYVAKHLRYLIYTPSHNIETISRIDNIKTILGVDQLNEENKEHCFKKFAKEHPILFQQVPEFFQHLGDIFVSQKYPNLVGIQELPMEFETI